MSKKSYSHTGFLGLGTFFWQLKTGDEPLNMSADYIKNRWLAKKVFQFKFITEAIWKSDYDTLSHIWEEWNLNRRWRRVWPYLGKAIQHGIVVTPHSGGYCQLLFTKDRLENTSDPDYVFIGIPMLEMQLTWLGTKVLIKILRKATATSDYDAWFQHFSAANLKTGALQVCHEHYAFGCWHQNKRLWGIIELFEDQRRKDVFDYWEYYHEFWDSSYSD